MAGTDTHKQLFSLIRDFASEKSQGERRIVGLKRQIEELQSELEAAHAELEDAKRTKESTEQELKGYEVELALTEASIQALEARISMTQNEIATVGSDLEALKNEEGASRDHFISQMFELNRKIRDFQRTIPCSFHEKTCIGTSAEDYCKHVEGETTQVTSRSLEDMLDHVISQITQEEEACLAEQNINIQVQKELIDLEEKVSLMDMITRSTEHLQELTRQTSEMEQAYTFLSEELQRRYQCPNCHMDNMESLALDGNFQGNEAN